MSRKIYSKKINFNVSKQQTEKNSKIPEQKNSTTKDKDIHVNTDIVIPHIIEIDMHRDYDIVSVHRIVVCKIKQDFGRIPSIRDQINVLKEEMKFSESVCVYKNYVREIEKREEMIKEFSDPLRLDTYTDSTSSILYDYHKIPHDQNRIDFMNKSNFTQPLTSHDVNRIDIIKKFLGVVNRYIPVIIRCDGDLIDDIDSYCLNCGKYIGKIKCDSGGVKICPNRGCRAMKYSYNISPVSLISENSKSSNKNYENISTFTDHMFRYEGKIIPDINIPNAIKKIDLYFESIGYHYRSTESVSNTDEADIASLNSSDISNTSVKIMNSALKAVGYSSHYKDVRFFAHIYWGWKYPDISGFRNIIIEYYGIVQKAWGLISVDDRGRRSNLPGQYNLYRLLELTSPIPIYRTDFKIDDTDSIANCDRCWKLICAWCEENGYHNKIYEI